MNKKQFLWFLLAMAIFVASGVVGVRSAANAREQSAAAAEQFAETFASAFGSTASAAMLPDVPYAARVDVKGTIMSSSGTASLLSSDGFDLNSTLDYVDQLIHDENNVGILLFIDSPGGEMKATDDLYMKLMDYKATGRPIYCYFDGTACSGGYYAAMASDEICANRNCVCVNIGVYIATYNMAGLFDKLGVEQIAFKSSENKGIGMTGIPWTDEQKEIYQSIVDYDYDLFLDVVARGRGMTKQQVRTLDDGREMTAGQALDAGFIDSIGRYEEYEAQVLEKLGTDVLYERAPAENSLQSLMQYFSSVLPRSDTQSLLDFAEAHSRAVVMAYAG